MIGNRLGKYEIKKWLGGGQFGDVYLAFDTILNAEFALKISRMREDEILMLKDEARLLASLNHQNIVRFFNIDKIEGKFVMVMEYVDGPSLRETIRKEKHLEIEPACEIVRQILEALIYAHNLNVVHRDLKPENILINREGVVKLTDFGLARFIKPGSISASTAGTPLYMAPEAWAGKFSPASDIWSTSVIFYEMLTGRPPFLADNLEELRMRIKEGDYLPVSNFEPKVPEKIQDLIQQGLKPDITDRPTPTDFLNSLTEKKRGIPLTEIAPIKPIPPEIVTPTPTQAEILADLSGPIILFGAPGSGKTTTLTLAVLKRLNDGVRPENILVVTFTNKAANDIKARLRKIQPGMTGLDDLWIGTFHFHGLKILRRWAQRLDFSEDFEIDSPEEIVKRLKIPSPGLYKVKAILNTISIFKAYGKFPDELNLDSRWQKTCVPFYKHYQQLAKDNNIMDFDDLILYTLRLIEENDDIKEFYANKFQAIFVDELQDTNLAQYQLVKHFAAVHNNIFFTGDEDQAIYGWRGAKKELMYQVYKDFPQIRSFILNYSFRLPERIVHLAENLIGKNRNFKEHIVPMAKTESGDATVFPADNEKEEAKFVVREIERLVKEENRNYSEIAVLFRRNVQSRLFEETFSHAGIPYSLIGGERFYTREEIKILTDYLTAVNQDNERLGLEAIGRIFKLDDRNRARLAELIKEGAEKDRSKKIASALKGYKIFKSHIRDKNLLYPVQILDAIVTASGTARTESERSENIKELFRVAQPFARGELSHLLEHIRLIENLDLLDWTKDAVKLMTIHSAKGLEFPIVFLTGMVEGQFPLLKSLNDQKDLEEERRLCYVAVTRAQEKIYITYPQIYQARYQTPS
ncbi:MAG: UvrD-helicase domain-containing protein, partial [candidate division WOR-3 bacterium]